MTFVNNIYQDKFISKVEYKEFLTLLYPFAPHLCEEMNEVVGFKDYICKSVWPTIREDNTIKTINMPVQINGKMRDTISVKEDVTQDEALEIINQNEKLKGYIEGGIKKVIFVPKKIINIIV